MELLKEQLSSNPVFLAIVIVLAILIVFAFLRRLMKLAFFVVLLLALYLGFLAWTGKSVPTTPEALKESVKKQVEGVEAAISKKVDEASEALKQKVRDTVEEKIDSAFRDSSGND
ncbi:MAG: hypothetical protein ACE5GH_06235 [Fidelibacterota bacterium]